MEEQTIIVIALVSLFGVPLMCGILCLCVDNTDRRPIKRMTKEDVDYYDSLPFK